MNIDTTLKTFGLTDKEIKVYIACLGLGSASVYQISQKANLPRSTCYEVLEALAKHGLISSLLKKKVQYYSAEPPETLIYNLRQRTEQLQTIIPQLQVLYGQAETKPQVRFYEGRAAVASILNEFLNEASEQIAFSSTEEFQVIGEVFKKYVDARVKRGIPAKVIMNDSPLAQQLKQSGSNELREVRILPKPYEHHNLIMVWNNKVAIFTLQKSYNVLITESEVVAGFYKMVFQFMWNSLQ